MRTSYTIRGNWLPYQLGVGYAVKWELLSSLCIYLPQIICKSLYLSETLIMVGIFCILFCSVQPVNRLCWWQVLLRCQLVFLPDSWLRDRSHISFWYSDIILDIKMHLFCVPYRWCSWSGQAHRWSVISELQWLCQRYPDSGTTGAGCRHSSHWWSKR